MWAYSLLGILFVTKLLTHLTLKLQVDDSSLIDSQKRLVIVNLLESVYSMSTIIDSKFIGLILFLTANISTGFVNLTVKTESVSSCMSLIILHGHVFFSVGISFWIYKLSNGNRITTIPERIEI